LRTARCRRAGLRINHKSSGTNDVGALVVVLQRWAPGLRGCPWRLQVYASLDAIAAAAPRLSDLMLPLVLDHFAMTRVQAAPTGARVQSLIGFMRSAKAYIKLSAAYRIGTCAATAQSLARMWMQTRPDRVLWSSDGPHTNREPGKGALQTSAYVQVAHAELAMQLAHWAPDTRSAALLLVDIRLPCTALNASASRHHRTVRGRAMAWPSPDS